MPTISLGWDGKISSMALSGIAVGDDMGSMGNQRMEERAPFVGTASQDT